MGALTVHNVGDLQDVNTEDVAQPASEGGDSLPAGCFLTVFNPQKRGRVVTVTLPDGTSRSITVRGRAATSVRGGEPVSQMMLIGPFVFQQGPDELEAAGDPAGTVSVAYPGGAGDLRVLAVWPFDRARDPLAGGW